MDKQYQIMKLNRNAYLLTQRYIFMHFNSTVCDIIVPAQQLRQNAPEPDR